MTSVDVSDLTGRLGRSFTSALVQGEGMNDFMHRFLAGIGEILEAPRLVLYDYDELYDVFDLLYFQGYPEDARSDLQTRLRRLDSRRALRDRDPFVTDDGARELLVPLYFQDTLEALLLLERAVDTRISAEECAPAFLLVSRFLGLFMSSNRLPVNQGKASAPSSDLERAREVQISYLPPPHTVTDRYEIFGYNQSSALVGGDYFDYFCRKPDSLQFVVADACGHGLPATFTMCTFRAMLHAEVERLDDLSPLFDTLNHQLYAGGNQLQYLAGVFCDYEAGESRLRYSNAGHFSPVLVRPDGTTAPLPGRGRPLGMFKDSTYEMYSHPVAAGDLLLLYTDGLFELRNAEDEFFGADGIVSVVAAHRGRPLRDIAMEVLASAARFSHSLQPDDDLTLFLVRFR